MNSLLELGQPSRPCPDPGSKPDCAECRFDGIGLRRIQCSAWPSRRRAAHALLRAVAQQADPGLGGLAVLAGGRIGQRVVHSRCLGLYRRARHGDYLPRPGVLMARQQSPLALIPLAGVSGDMRRDLVPQRDGQHSAAPPPTRSHMCPPPMERTLVGDHLRHWRLVLPTLAAAFSLL